MEVHRPRDPDAQEVDGGVWSIGSVHLCESVECDSHVEFVVRTLPPSQCASSRLGRCRASKSAILRSTFSSGGGPPAEGARWRMEEVPGGGVGVAQGRVPNFPQPVGVRAGLWQGSSRVAFARVASVGQTRPTHRAYSQAGEEPGDVLQEPMRTGAPSQAWQSRVDEQVRLHRPPPHLKSCGDDGPDGAGGAPTGAFTRTTADPA